VRQTKRLYDAVTVGESPSGFSVLLDGRPVKTPAGAVLSVPSHALGLAIANEWSDQKEKIDPVTMPLHRLAVSAIDRIGNERNAVIEGLVGYSKSDLLCYRAERPEELVERQEAAWQPILDWVADTYDARFAITIGVVPVVQPTVAVRSVGTAVGRLDDFTLAALAAAAAACGSVLLGLALVAGRIGPDEAREAAQLDELFQAERWGEDEEAAARRLALFGEIRAAKRFIELSRDGVGSSERTECD
jgi:chaperone required for assembly of F1-ATPase